MGIHSKTVLRTFQEGIDKFNEFNIGNVRGEWYASWIDVPKGQLDVSDRMPSMTDAVYVVFSYETPIAWRIDLGKHSQWVIPDVTYSRTTTQHQNLVRVATAYKGFYPIGA